MLRVNNSIKKSLKTIVQSKNVFFPLTQASKSYSASYDEWKNIAKKQLKDSPVESLISKTAEVKLQMRIF